jgi:two-component system NarL family sensor kinase
MRESLRNVSSHAQAKRVLVRLSCEKDRVTLIVSDDGVGFEPAALDAPASGHVGLDLLRDDVNEAGGVFWVDSTPRKGSRVNVVLPVIADAQPAPSPMATTH